jgi:hypothetical protein
MEFPIGETVTAAPPQQIEALRAELVKQWREFSNDQRLQPGERRGN